MSSENPLGVSCELYARIYYSGIWTFHREIASREILAEFPDLLFKLLDIGSGPVPSLPQLLGGKAEYHCLDFYAPALEKLRLDFPACRAVAGEAENLPYAQESFETVLLFGVIHHLENPEKVINEVKRVLKPGGCLWAFEPAPYWDGKFPNPEERGLSSTDLNRILSPLGEPLLTPMAFIPMWDEIFFQPLIRLKLWEITAQDPAFWAYLAGLEKAASRLYPEKGTFHLARVRKKQG